MGIQSLGEDGSPSPACLLPSWPDKPVSPEQFPGWRGSFGKAERTPVFGRPAERPLLRAVPGVSPLTTSGRKPQTTDGLWISVLFQPHLAEWPWVTLILPFIVQPSRSLRRRSLGPPAVTVHRPGTKAQSCYSVNDSSQPFPENKRVRGKQEGQGRGLGRTGKLGALKQPWWGL